MSVDQSVLNGNRLPRTKEEIAAAFPINGLDKSAMELAEMATEIIDNKIAENSKQIEGMKEDLKKLSAVEQAQLLILEDRTRRENEAVSRINAVLKELNVMILPEFSWPSVGEPYRGVKVVAQ